jgi:predicted phosphoribosyltransferase/dienelactone hydrolase
VEFADRRDAGRQLASQLAALAGDRPVVVALPRGGVPVGYEVATALGAPLEILAVRKLGAPGNPEFAVGAIAEDGTTIVNEAVARRVGMTPAVLEATTRREAAELRRRVERYRDGREPVDLRGRTVVVVDDGVATGLTDLAAVRALRGRGAERIVVAVPVGPAESIAMLGDEADEVVCHTVPRDMVGVGRWYRDFSPVSDEEVVELLVLAAAREPGGGGADERASGRAITVDVDGHSLAGELSLPARPRGLVIFAHGSGSSRLSPRNRAVAATLFDAGLATLLFDLLTESESARRELLFDIPLLADRLAEATRWALREPATRALPIGYFGASTGAAAALRAAAAAPDAVRAVVSRGGRPDLAGERLAAVRAPTLLIVGGLDATVLALNRHAADSLACPHRLVIVEGADHLFTQDGTLEEVALLAAGWFGEHLNAAAVAAAGG